MDSHLYSPILPEEPGQTLSFQISWVIMQLMMFRRGKGKGRRCQETTCGQGALSIQPAKELLNWVLLAWPVDHWRSAGYRGCSRCVQSRVRSLDLRLEQGNLGSGSQKLWHGTSPSQRCLDAVSISSSAAAFHLLGVVDWGNCNGKWTSVKHIYKSLITGCFYHWKTSCLARTH